MVIDIVLKVSQCVSKMHCEGCLDEKEVLSVICDMRSKSDI
jgi:hypothetical protein